MALNASNIRVGARRMIWDPTGVNLDLGITMDGSVLRVEKGGEEILGEQNGIAPVDFVYAGEKVTFRGAFREWGSANVNDILLTLLPGSTQSTGPTVREWQFGSTAGVLASTIAKELLLRPEKNVGLASPAEEDDDVVIYLAAPLMLAEVLLNNLASSGVWSASFIALVDNSKLNGNKLGRWKTDR